MRWNNNIRKTLAIFQASLLCLILTSGSLFMHKHTTASGQIVIHTHPYDFSTGANDPVHHDSEDQIHFLDVVFQGSYLQTSFAAYPLPYTVPHVHTYPSALAQVCLDGCEGLSYLRGPPAAC